MVHKVGWNLKISANFVDCYIISQMNTRFLLSLLSIAFGFTSLANAEEIQIGEKQYKAERLIERKIGPGTTYIRLRLPDYPLNVNLVTVDLNNPFNRIETTIANESAKGTESLVTAARRQDSEAHHPLAAANANFWVVGSQKEYPLYAGITRNANVRNGKMVTESNKNKEKWDGGTERTGVVTVSYDKTLNIDYCTPTLCFKKAPSGTEKNIQTCNKGFQAKAYAMYNSFYGRDREFMPYTEGTDSKGNKQYQLKEDVTDGIEVYLTMDEGEKWTGGEDIKFTVKEVKKNTNARGKLGDYDLAIVSFGGANQTLKVGDPVVLKYYWTFEGNITPVVEQAIGGNAMVMRQGELTEHNYNEDYNSMVYSRTAYGCSKDGKTLYMLVIDKSTDPVYGKSAGCSTEVMCEIARHFGCYNMSNFDAGGSAELMVDFAIVNKTTESTPRNVANGWMVFSIAPDDDNNISSLEFDHPVIDVPATGSFTPTLLGYNKYGVLLNKNVENCILTCDPNLGRCEGNVFIAADVPAEGMLTATLGDISVSKKITVAGGVSSVESVAEDAQVISPASVRRGETFRIHTSGVNINFSEILNLDGKILSKKSGNGSEMNMTAPAMSGIFVLHVCREDGLSSSRKFIVK